MNKRKILFPTLRLWYKLKLLMLALTKYSYFTRGKGMTAQDVAKYYLMRASDDGDLITNLKMQKLVYYAYAWVQVTKQDKLFGQPIEAWPNGPVVASLYGELKKYGSMPIPEEYIGNAETVFATINSSGFKEEIDAAYEKFMPLSAFELVALTHAEEPWAEIRKGKEATEPSREHIKDATIRATYNFA